MHELYKIEKKKKLALDGVSVIDHLISYLKYRKFTTKIYELKLFSSYVLEYGHKLCKKSVFHHERIFDYYLFHFK